MMSERYICHQLLYIFITFIDLRSLISDKAAWTWSGFGNLDFNVHNHRIILDFCLLIHLEAGLFSCYIPGILSYSTIMIFLITKASFCGLILSSSTICR
jgi:hypothetical protein